MSRSMMLAGVAILAWSGAVAQSSGGDAVADAHRLAALPPVRPPAGHSLAIDDSGRKQTGKASIYAGHFQGRPMADGGRFSQASDSAASRTLPLGTVAKVTNLKTRQTATVVVRDHGPFAAGQAVDVSSHTARQLGLTHREGVAPVVVAPVAVPQPDGTTKPGAGAVPGPATAK